MTNRRKKSQGDGETVLAYSTAAPLPSRAVGGGARPLDPASSQPRLRLDRRGSGRVVTTITGINGGSDALAALGGALRAACGAGGTVKDGVIEIQGDHRDTLEKALLARGFRCKRSGG